MDDRTIEALASGEPVGTGGPLLDEHVICPACAHNFGAISQTSRDRIAELEAALATAARRFEWLAAADDTMRNGVRPSVGAAEINDVLKKS